MSAERRCLLNCSAVLLLLLVLEVSVCKTAEEEQTTFEETAEEAEGRQMMGYMGSMNQRPMFYHTTPPQPFDFNNFVRRRLASGMESMGDISTLATGGVLALGIYTLLSWAGLGLTQQGSSKKRTRRGLLDVPKHHQQLIRSLFDMLDIMRIMDELEKSFQTYGIDDKQCRMRAMCEACMSDTRLGPLGQTIRHLVSQQRELQSKEVYPVSRYYFAKYAEAVHLGETGANCPLSYPDCTQNVFDFLRAEEHQHQDDNDLKLDV